VIELPPLIERGEDLVHLAAYFATQHACVLDAGAIMVLRGHEWPGNVRELRLAITRASLLSRSTTLAAGSVAEAIAMGSAFVSPAPTSQSVDPEHHEAQIRGKVLAAFAANGRNASRTAQALGIGRTTLFKHLKALKISLRAERGSLPGD
jgi:DNA-binding NtrC family response regulator